MVMMKKLMKLIIVSKEKEVFVSLFSVVIVSLPI